MTPDLLILCATLAEMPYFLSAHPPKAERVTRTGPRIFFGRLKDKAYDLMITGPGVFNAAHALTVYLEQASPALVLQTGIAGVFRETGLDIGDVAVATGERYIHTGVAADSPIPRPLPFDLISGLPSSREGRYEFDPGRVDACHESLSRGFEHKNIRVARDLFITVSTLSSSFDQAGRLHSALSPIMEAMEGAASAHIAALYKVPFIEVRAASNFTGERDKGKWDVERAAKHLGEACTII
jgi:futalosine hydrolase